MGAILSGTVINRPIRRLPHVALVIGALHSIPGGAERVLVDLANQLHRSGYPVTVVTYQDRNGPSFYPLDFGIIRLDGRRRHVPRRTTQAQLALRAASRRRSGVAVATWLATYVPRVVRLRKMLRITRPDVAIGFMPSTFPYLVLAAWMMRTATVASIHNVPFRELGGDPARWDQNPVDIRVRRWSLRRADAATVLLPSFVQQLEPSVQPSTYVIPNMIPSRNGRAADVQTEPDGNLILAVGRLSPAKDHETLIRAWARIEADHPTWHVEIYGQGPLRDALDAVIEATGVQRLTIESPTNEIDDVYARSKFLVMPSIYEGFGLVTAEALASGLPVIGFADCDGTNEIVIDGYNGVLVQPGDDRAGALAEVMHDMIRDERTRIDAARRAPGSVEQFGPQLVLAEWERMIHDLEPRRRRRG